MKSRSVLGVSLALVIGGLIFGSGVAFAADEERTLVIKDHVFSPSEIEIPANVRVKLIVDNQDATPEEFESRELHREKVIPGNTKGIIWVGPLPTGEYPFVGEFHEATAKGKIIVK